MQASVYKCPRNRVVSTLIGNLGNRIQIVFKIGILKCGKIA